MSQVLRSLGLAGLFYAIPGLSPCLGPFKTRRLAIGRASGEFPFTGPKVPLPRPSVRSLPRPDRA